MKKVSEWRPDFRRTRERSKNRWKEHKKAKNPQLKGEDPGSEVMEENHKRNKDEQGIKIGTKENVKQLNTN